jgi:Protein of unknown function (DUF3800)
MIVTVYIDESGTHESGVTVLGGWVGRMGQWSGFDPLWRKLLKKNGLDYFHSKSMRQSRGQFRGWKVFEKFEFTQRAADLALKHLEFGFSIALSDAAYEQHYVAGYRPKEIPLDTRYGLCFRHCLSLVPMMAKDAFKGRQLDINFVLESGHKKAGDAQRVFDRVRTMGLSNPNEIEIVQMLNTLAFEDKARFPGLQVADINAYSAYQHESGARVLEVGTIENPANAVAEGKRIQKTPVFRLELRELELQTYKRFVLEEIAERKARHVARSSKRDRLISD